MIKTEMLTKKFDDFIALSNINCCIPKGCIYGLVGSNGAGKSTLLRLITGVYKPDSGIITIEEQSVFENPETKNKIAYVPDELFFLASSNMNKMADFYSAYYKNFDKKRFNELADTFRLDPNKSVNTFSKGMKRQVAIILALSCRPSYYFFDETFDGLDPVMRHLVKSIICKDIYENNSTAIITSHSLRELEDTCDQLALLHQGGLIFESDIQNLKTSMFKVQIAFKAPFSKEAFSNIDILHFSKHGSVANIIVRGDHDETIAKLSAMSPIILDILPLSLEEVFTYETEALGYSFENILEAE